MPAYIIALIHITDRERYSAYMNLAPTVIAAFGGKFIARGGRTTTLEGAPEDRRVVLVEFPTFERAEAFYRSEQHAQMARAREGAATATFILVEGCVPPRSI